MQNSKTFSRFLLAGGMLSTLFACGDSTDIALQQNTSGHGAAMGEECNLEGTWAIKFTIPVTWGANIGIKAGGGDIVQWARTERQRADASTVVDALVPCGSVVPDYQSQAIFKSELYGTRFPDSLYDTDVLKPTEVRTTLAGFTVGSTFQSGFAPIQLGVEMADPLNDLWPAKGSALKSIIDGDNDGNPGVTINSDTGPGYSLPPTNMFGTKRANQFFVAVRNVASTSGVIDSCDKLSAQAQIATIGGKAAINSHVLGCRRDDGSNCTQSEADLLDRFQPNYVPKGATATMVRVDSNTTCAQIRAMTF